MIYLDYASSTPLHPLLKEKLDEVYAWIGNIQSDQMIDFHKIEKESKQKICQYFNGDPKRLFFTSGATESINAAIIGGARFYRQSGNHIILFETEHQAVLSACHALSKEGFETSILPVQSDGLISYDNLEDQITDKTILVTVNGLCNETGLIQDLKPLIKLKKKYGFMIHLDASQMIGKVRFDIETLPVDFISLSSHKCYGPQGIGALYIAKGRHIQPIINGVDPVRSGTMPIALICFMGDAYSIADKSFKDNQVQMAKLRKRFIKGLKGLEYTVLTEGADSIINIRFHDINENKIKIIRENIYCQVSSACKSGLSHVLQARLPYQYAKECLRFSFGIFTTEKEIDNAVGIIQKALS